MMRRDRPVATGKRHLEGYCCPRLFIKADHFECFCGVGILAGLLIGAYGWTQTPTERVEMRTVYWAELIALVCFGIAWLWAGSYRFLFGALAERHLMKEPHLERSKQPFWEQRGIS